MNRGYCQRAHPDFISLLQPLLLHLCSINHKIPLIISFFCGEMSALYQILVISFTPCHIRTCNRVRKVSAVYFPTSSFCSVPCEVFLGKLHYPNTTQLQMICKITHFGQNCSNVTIQIFHSLGQTTPFFMVPSTCTSHWRTRTFNCNFRHASTINGHLWQWYICGHTTFKISYETMLPCVPNCHSTRYTWMLWVFLK